MVMVVHFCRMCWWCAPSTPIAFPERKWKRIDFPLHPVKVCKVIPKRVAALGEGREMLAQCLFRFNSQA